MFDATTTVEQKFEKALRHAAVAAESPSLREKFIDVLMAGAEQRGYELSKTKEKTDEEYVHGDVRPSDGKRKFGTVWLSANAWNEANAEFMGGRKIQAIKAVRTDTGLGLKEAKDILDAMVGNHGYHANPNYPPGQ